MKHITVSTSRSYQVHIGNGILPSIGMTIHDLCCPQQIAIVTDTNVGPLYLECCRESIRRACGAEVIVHCIPAGEVSKSADEYWRLVNRMASSHMTRTDCVIALGGGVVGDLAGFAAATYLRGIPFIQVPTTLLAAVDSSVGGKTAIDLPAGKNLLGAFYQPRAVICDIDTLNTLPADVFRDGCAEVIKYGILYDAALFTHLFDRGLDFDREYVIARCVALKRDVVAADEFDRGARQLLNLGHTIGHGIEAQSNFTIPHGHAVAIGMAVVARASCALGICTSQTRNWILEILERFGLPVYTSFSPKSLYASALSDKKRTGSTVNLVVPQCIGRCILHPTPIEELQSFIEAGL